MQRRVAILAAALWCACDPKIPTTEPTAVITAQFDPSAVPPVVPTPNDLATDPKTGLLKVSAPPGASAIDKEFYAYLSTLNGFPASAIATAAFDGNLDADRVRSADSVKVYDVTAGFTTVAVMPLYSQTGTAEMPGSKILIPPPVGGWIASHAYAIGLVGGSAGLKGDADSGGRPVVGSATWTFLRASKPLVVCPGDDLTSPACETATEIVPSDIKDDPEARLADQTAKALQLEQLRLKYKPVIDKLVADGVKREDIVLAWTFRVAGLTEMVFDPASTPPRVPTPTDLVVSRTTGLLNVPIDPSYSAAYQEFIRDYLNTLDGFPVSATAQASVAGGDLDPATVTNQTVIVFPLDGKPPPGVPNVRWNATTKTIDISPPNGSWGKGRHFAVAVIGRLAADRGAPGRPPAVEQVGGGAVIGSSIWAIARSKAPLVECPNNDFTSPDCVVRFTAAPLTYKQITDLETLRQLYAPALDALEAQGHPRKEVALMWTFGTVSLPEATFDPAAAIIPFPNDVLRTTGASPHLNLPIPDGGSALQQGLVQGLNTLDGFSLTAPIVSESSDTKGALDIGSLDPATFDAGTGFLRLEMATQPVVDVCLNCASSKLPDGGVPANPEQLQFVPRLPLREGGKYGAYLTTALRDTAGKRVIPSGAFALARMVNPLCDANMKSTVPVLSDVQACGAGGQPGLEQLRAGMQPLIDGLKATRNVDRKDLALAWAFTTETTVSELQALSDAVAAVPTLVTNVQLAPVPTAAVVPAALRQPTDYLGTNMFIGTVTMPFALTGPGNTIRPPNGWSTEKAAFMLTVPATAPPANGYPVVIFGHGLTSNRTAMVAIANALASAGFATVAIDVVWHGERTTCKGSAAALRASIPTATDDYACTTPGGTMPNPAAAVCSQTTGRCVAADPMTGADCSTGGDPLCISLNQGYCLGTGRCEGADFLRNTSKAPVVNAWNFLNLGNLFAARDNFRHYAIDLTQLVKIIKADAFMNAPGGPYAAANLDGTTINYVGQSLGGFNGTLFGAVSPDAKYVMLNVPGSDQVDALLTSPGFQQVRDGFLAQLAPLGLTPGTPQFDQLTTLLKTIFDKSDPQNFGFTAVNRVTPAGRKVFIQSIQDDFVVPNFTTDKLIAAANSGAGMAGLQRVNPPFTTLMPADRHGFLLNFRDPATTAAAQTAAVTFLATGVTP